MLQVCFANPLYDSAFKFLMEDADLARGIIARLLGCKVLHIELRPQEVTLSQPMSSAATLVPALQLEPPESIFRIFRLDFCAEIEQPGANGKPVRRRVLIELQKSQLSDVRRFRVYLGRNYLASDKGESLPLIPIYLLGYNSDKRLPKVTRVQRTLSNGLTGRPVDLGKDQADVPLIEQLTHNAVVVQLASAENPGEISDHELEHLLSVFDQRRQLTNNHLLLTVDGPLQAMAETDPLLRSILRVLQSAASDDQTMRNMEAEDQVQDAFSVVMQERDAALTRVEAEKQEKDAALQEKDAAMQEKDAAMQEKDAALKREEAAQQQIQALVEKLRQHGIEPGA